jgi:hypothetical protein
MTTIHGNKFSTRVSRPATIGATATLRVQLPLIGANFPEILAAVPGTINLGLEQPLLVLFSDYRTAPIDWENKGNYETFDLLRAQLEIRGVKYDGWLYVAHGSPHRADLKTHEFIAQTRVPIRDDDSCLLHISRECASVPYSPLVVVL